MSVRESSLDPVAAYDQVAPHYGKIASRRTAYLDAIEQLIASNIPIGARSMLDVGSGDGRRALRIARIANIPHVVLSEPSPAMRALWPSGVNACSARAEDLDQPPDSFHVITCLWNTIGHVPNALRMSALTRMIRALHRSGFLFIDVNHRYNAAHYGWLRTAGRMLQDCITPSISNGDVFAQWHFQGLLTRTYGHVFTHREFASLARNVGASIVTRYVIDYETGQIRKSSMTGNLLYVLGRP